MSQPSKTPKVKKNFPMLGDISDIEKALPYDLADFDRTTTLKWKKDFPERYAEAIKVRRYILWATGVSSFGDLMNRSEDQEFIDHLSSRFEKAANGTLEFSDDQKLWSKTIKEARTFFRKVFGMKPIVNHKKRRHEEIKDYFVMTDKEGYARAADALVASCVQKFVPGHTELGMINEIRNCNNPAELLLISLDDSWADIARFQARRKLVLMELSATVGQVREKQKQDLSSLDKLMNKHVYSHSDMKKGDHEKRIIISEHDESTECIEAKVIDFNDVENEEGEMMKKNGIDPHDLGVLSIDEDDVDEDEECFEPEIAMTRITQLPSRSIKVKDGDGEREIKYMADNRHKEQISINLKCIRKDNKEADRISKDINGIRNIFDDEDDLEFFEKFMKEQFEAAGHRVEEGETKEAVGGELKCRKNNIQIDGRRYERQNFTPLEYANYLYRRPYSWPEYEVKRFFESSSSEALFPDRYYPNLDREKLCKTAAEQNYRKYFSKSPGVEWESGFELEDESESEFEENDITLN